ncbi:MAG: protoporphyrinogen oxidase [Gammaproteobacteria bacterium]|nr:protoporphyrinogen oxidase [Gammaproteobacteria bacterium]
MSDIDVLVIGGGISGLTVARLLAQRGLRAEVWEKNARPGGKIATDRRSGYLTERAAAMVLNFRPEVTQFMRDFGLADSRIMRDGVANRYLVDQGRLLPVPLKIGAMIFSPLWSTQGKLRLLAEPFIPRGNSENETVSEFVRRRLGSEVLEKAMGPFITGPLASDPDLANAHATLPRLTALEKRYGSLTLGVFVHKVLRRRTATETEAFSFQGGMSTLIESLARSDGVQFQGQRSVTELIPHGNSWTIHATSPQGEHSVRAKQVVLCTPADAAATLLQPVDNDLAGLLSGIEYAPISVVHTGFPEQALSRPLDGAGFLVPRGEGGAVTGCSWMSSMYPGRAPEGNLLLSSYLGGACAQVAATLNEEQCTTATMQTLRSLLRIKGDPDMLHVDRHPLGLPLYHGAYPARMRAIDERLRLSSGLHLEANYRGGISIRDRILCAYRAVERIESELVRHTSARPGRETRHATTNLADLTAK